MLRLNLYCSVVPSSRKANYENSFSTIIQHDRKQILHGRIRFAVRALKDERDGRQGGAPGQSWDPGLEVEVPFEQRPVNEYSSLKDESLYSWADLGPGSFLLRLGGLWLVTFTVLGVPIAAASFNPSKDPLHFVLAAGTGTLFLVALIVLRIYLGWSYVGDRLLSAVIPYEESGWYDGQMWVKPPEILARDRLLGSYKVKPVIKLLKQTLVGTGALLVAAASLFIFATPVEDFINKTFLQKENPSNVSASKISTKFNIRKEELLRLPIDVKSDDDLAAAAAEAADGRPYLNQEVFLTWKSINKNASAPIVLLHFVSPILEIHYQNAVSAPLDLIASSFTFSFNPHSLYTMLHLAKPYYNFQKIHSLSSSYSGNSSQKMYFFVTFRISSSLSIPGFVQTKPLNACEFEPQIYQSYRARDQQKPSNQGIIAYELHDFLEPTERS